MGDAFSLFALCQFLYRLNGHVRLVLRVKYGEAEPHRALPHRAEGFVQPGRTVCAGAGGNTVVGIKHVRYDRRLLCPMRCRARPAPAAAPSTQDRSPPRSERRQGSSAPADRHAGTAPRRHRPCGRQIRPPRCCPPRREQCRCHRHCPAAPRAGQFSMAGRMVTFCAGGSGKRVFPRLLFVTMRPCKPE